MHIETNYNCSVCSETFMFYVDLLKHAIAHIEDFPHFCKKCGKIYKVEKSLSEHIGTCFPSVDCGNTYSRKSDLTRHQHMFHAVEKTSAAARKKKLKNLSQIWLQEV